MTAFPIKQDDTGPSLQATLADNGAARDLAGCSVSFVMRALTRADGRVCLGPVLKVDAAATVVDAALGKVRYDWATGDTDTVGNFGAEFKVLKDGRETTYPTKGYLLVTVIPDLR